MEGKNFEAPELKHIKGQEGQVEDPEKAHEMAEREDVYQTFANLYEEYLTDPDKYNKEHGKGIRNWPVLDNTPQMCEYLAEMKVPPEYIRKLGEIDAEAFGEIFDYDKTIKDKNDAQLLFDQARLWGEEIVHNIKRSMLKKRGPDYAGGFGVEAMSYAESPEYFSELAREWSARYRRSHAYYARKRKNHPLRRKSEK